MSDTKTPAQADEKALEAAAVAIHCAADNADAIELARLAVEAYLAALRPEGEAVAWMNPEHLAAYRSGARDGIAWSSPEKTEFYSEPLYATPPAPAQVEAASLPAQGGVVGVVDWRAVAKAAERHGIRYRTNAALESFLSDIRAAIATDASPSGESERVKRAMKLADGYGIALKMIAAGCSDPKRFAGRMLDEYADEFNALHKERTDA
jgi:hypothetical protein